MAEALRNEVAITLAGEERTMRATFTAIRSIEQSLGVSIIEVMRRVAGANLGVGDTATIIFNGLKGFDDTRLKLDEVGEAVMQEGLTNLLKPVMDFVIKAMDGVKVGKSETAGE